MAGLDPAIHAFLPFIPPRHQLLHMFRRKSFTIGLFIGVALMLVYESRDAIHMPVPIPQQESAFIAAAADARQAWLAAPNDLARASMRAARAAALCNALPGLSAADWRGTVQQIIPDSFPDYAGHKTVRIVINLQPHLALTTPAAPLLNLPNTMVQEGTPVYAAAAALPIGSPVKFSANFFPDGTDCMAETSLTRAGSMTDPVFKIRLTAFAKN
jgi:hypothetical protein